jgi:cation diffusion facilitator CzcD-associated flavoprotein CzcO
VVLERGDEVGGVWRDNTYPGAACDVPSHLYSYSFAPDHRWSRRFAPQPDILRYLHRVVEAAGLRRHLRTGTEVTEARWEEATATWRLTTSTGDTVEVEVLVPACGQMTRPTVPDLPGLGTFRGPVLHFRPLGSAGGPARAARRCGRYGREARCRSCRRSRTTSRT